MQGEEEINIKVRRRRRMGGHKGIKITFKYIKDIAHRCRCCLIRLLASEREWATRHHEEYSWYYYFYYCHVITLNISNTLSELNRRRCCCCCYYTLGGWNCRKISSEPVFWIFLSLSYSLTQPTFLSWDVSSKMGYMHQLRIQENEVFVIC